MMGNRPMGVQRSSPKTPEAESDSDSFIVGPQIWQPFNQDRNLSFIGPNLFELVIVTRMFRVLEFSMAAGPAIRPISWRATDLM